MRRCPSFATRLAVLAVLAWAAPAAAGGHGPPHGFGPPPGAMLDYHADQLGLDAETRDAIRAIVEASHARSEALDEAIDAEQRRLFELMDRDPVDHDAVMDQVERIGALKTDERKHRIETMLAIHEQLTPEQREALKELQGSMRRHHLGPILEACDEDAEALCGRGGPPALHCLMRNRDDLSAPCAEALEGMPRFGRKGHHCEHHGGPHGGPPPPADE